MRSDLQRAILLAGAGGVVQVVQFTVPDDLVVIVRLECTKVGGISKIGNLVAKELHDYGTKRIVLVNVIDDEGRPFVIPGPG